MCDVSSAIAVLLACLTVGVNFSFWAVVGVMRLATTTLSSGSRGRKAKSQIGVHEVAVVIPAHNEELAISKCIGALRAVVPVEQVFVGSDGSRDRTVELARATGCNVLDIQPNGGKARAIQTVIDQNRLLERFKVVLIQDADSEIDPDYLTRGLPLFDDPRVVVVAGHVRSRWPQARGMTALIAAYRTRLYLLVQAAYKYAQTWGRINVAYIAPGFCSMYRTSVLSKIDITAPGLIIEDFNMTFEVQRKRLGRIAYTPRAMCSTEDPLSLRDYRKQCVRWYMGLWQTVMHHGFWPSRFWLSFGALMGEAVLFGVMQTATLVFLLLYGLELVGVLPAGASQLFGVSPLELVLIFLALDYAMTVAAAVIERRPSLLLYGIGFPLMRLLDIWLFCVSLPKAILIVSDGTWKSPTRSADRPADVRSPGLTARKGEALR